MTKKNPNKIRSLVIIVLLIVIVFSIVKWKKKNDAKSAVQNITRTGSSTVNTVTPTVTTSHVASSSGSGSTDWKNKRLQRGSRGPEVTALQKLINKNRDLFNMKHVGVDGVYGNEVETAVLRMTNNKWTTFNKIKKVYEYNFKKKNPTNSIPSFSDIAVQGASTIANTIWNPLSLIGL